MKYIIKQIIADHLDLDVDNISSDKHIMNDLGADSLDTVEIVMQLEEEFDIDIPDADAETLETVGHIEKYIEGLEQ
mgnify:CR=1 FL=1|tara:strand:- start:200 stop:427 length:228 start_codon:yes stop_codon:yes gene_type:complete